MAAFRYMVGDVEASVAFYTICLDFTRKQQFSPAMAIVSRGDLSLWPAGAISWAAKAMPDGRKPEPGGWNRIVPQVEDVAHLVARLKRRDVPFLNEIVSGPGGQQILVADPSGNVIELF